MIKYLFILLNSLSLFIYSLFSGDGGITVTNDIPKNMKPGQEVPVEIKVAKGNQSGFAKLQIEMPAGFSAKEIDNKGANYNFSDGIVKWVWSSLPSDAEMVVKFTLVADAGAALGTKTITGKYSYVENNGKMVVEMAPVEVTIGTEGSVAANTNTNQTGPETNTGTPTNTTAASPTTEVTNTVAPQSNSNSEPAGNITVQRTFSKGATDGEYVVNLKIKKGATKGFARYSDDLPADLTAKAGKTEGASFSVSDGKIKFVWVAVPEKDELELSYIINGISKPLALNGEYSYLEQNQSKNFLLTAETINPENVAGTSNTNTNTPANTNTTSAEQNTTVAVTNTQTSENTNTTVPTNTTQPVETLTKKEGNVNYMVQIGAFTNSEVTASRLTRKFSISEKIKSEMQGGFSKFMVGDHSEYKNARDHREKMRNNNGVASAFVVAYNTGKRITVQEALMISNQKWFK